MSASIGKAVLVTGCSEGGLGAAFYRAFRQQGFHVFATARELTRAAELKDDGIEVLSLDVTSSESIATCLAYIQTKTGGKLDVLVNNAGQLKVAPLLDVSIAESRKTFDVNVWVLLEVTQAFSPLLIKSRGVVVNISSIQSVISMVYHGIYAASKSAVTSISNILRLELEPFGVRVVTAMVGAVDTKIYENHEKLRNGARAENTLYSLAETNIIDAATGRVILGMETPEKTARDIVQDIIGGKSGQIWRGALAGRTRALTWILPTGVLDKYLTAGRGLEKVHPPNK